MDARRNLLTALFMHDRHNGEGIRSTSMAQEAVTVCLHQIFRHVSCHFHPDLGQHVGCSEYHCAFCQVPRVNFAAGSYRRDYQANEFIAGVIRSRLLQPTVKLGIFRQQTLNMPNRRLIQARLLYVKQHSFQGSRPGLKSSAASRLMLISSNNRIASTSSVVKFRFVNSD